MNFWAVSSHQEPEDTSTASLLNLEPTENILEVRKTSMLTVYSFLMQGVVCKVKKQNNSVYSKIKAGVTSKSYLLRFCVCELVFFVDGR